MNLFSLKKFKNYTPPKSVNSSKLHIKNMSSDQDTNPKVFFDLNCNDKPLGRLTMILRADACPITCENFRCLCTGEKEVNNKKITYKGTFSIEWSMISWFRVVILRGEMVLGGIRFMEDSLKMRILGFLIISLGYYQWLMLVRIPMVVSFLLRRLRRRFWIRSMWCLEKSRIRRRIGIFWVSWIRWGVKGGSRRRGCRLLIVVRFRFSFLFFFN